MRRRFLRAVLMTAAAFVTLPLTERASVAREVAAGDLRIDAAWTRAVGERAPTAAGYLIIRNTSAAADRLVAAETPRARAVELHEMAMTDGVMRMRPITGGIALPAGQEVRLAPGGGMHLMLIGPQGGFRQGSTVPVTLVFERTGRVDIELFVEAAGARRPSGHQGH